MDMVRGQLNCILWSEIHISEGLRFPRPPLIHQFLYYNQIHPFYVHVNIIQVLLGMCILNKLDWYYLVADAQPLHLVTNLPNTSKNKTQGNVLVFGAWGYAKDPMLREFPVPSLPSVGWYQSPHAYLIASFLSFLPLL